MTKYYVFGGRCGQSEGGMACGPVGGHDIACLEYAEIVDNRIGERKYLTLAVVEGVLNVTVTDKDIFDSLIAEESDNDFWDYVNEHVVYGIGDAGIYRTVEETLDELKNDSSDDAELIRKACALLTVLD